MINTTYTVLFITLYMYIEICDKNNQLIFPFFLCYIQVLDYTQYYLDLDSANKNGEAIWQLEYNLTTHYFVSGEVTAVALHNLVERFPNTENPLFTK